MRLKYVFQRVIFFLLISTSTGCLISKWSYPDNIHSWSIWLTGDGQPYLEISTDGSIPNIYAAISDLITDEGEFHHIAVVFNSGIVDFYVDGVKDTKSIGGNISQQSNSPTNCGDRRQINGEFVQTDGMMDEVTLWNRSLAEEEVQSLMFNSPNGTEEGLSGYWPFNTGTGGTAFDATDNNNHGTLSGASWVENEPVPGCLDPLAENYNSDANFDDSGCEYYDNYSLYFEGNGDYVDCGENIIPQTGPFTISIWKKGSSYLLSQYYNSIPNRFLFSSAIGDNGEGYGIRIGDSVYDPGSYTSENEWHNIILERNED